MSDETLGRLLVALQLALIALLAVLAAPAFLTGRAPLPAWLSAAAGAAIGLWALRSNRPGNFNIRPQPRAGGRLVQTGPYRWIRHPMYSAVLLFGVAAVAAVWVASGAQALLASLGLGLLAAVLGTKAGLEERWMQAHHPAYADYMRRTRRFVPGVV